MFYCFFRISPYLVRIRENTGQNNSKYGHFSCGAIVLWKQNILLFIQIFSVFWSVFHPVLNSIYIDLYRDLSLKFFVNFFKFLKVSAAFTAYLKHISSLIFRFIMVFLRRIYEGSTMVEAYLMTVVV